MTGEKPPSPDGNPELAIEEMAAELEETVFAPAGPNRQPVEMSPVGERI